MFHCELARVSVRILAVFFLLVSSQCYGQLRKVAVGDKMPEFSLPDANGVEFSYKRDKKKVLAVMFVSQKQQNSARAIATAKRVVDQLQSEGASGFELVAVTTEEPNATFVKSCMKENEWLVRLLIDSKYQLWGKLGVIAMPTVVVCGKDDVVFWVKAGYGHDFEPGLRVYLQEALGLIGKGEASKSFEVKTLKSTGTQARLLELSGWARRQMGQLEGAEKDLLEATKLDPRSARAFFELGKLYHGQGKTDQAVEAYHEALRLLFDEPREADPAKK